MRKERLLSLFGIFTLLFDTSTNTYILPNYIQDPIGLQMSNDETVQTEEKIMESFQRTSV
jgi:hypothetical protein